MNPGIPRRKFFGLAALSGTGLVVPQLGFAAGPRVDDNVNHIGPKEGYSPQIGTLVSMLDWLSQSVFGVTKGLSVEELDYLHDKDSNTIGSLMYHIAATEVIYLDLTVHGLNNFSDQNKEKFGIAMELGEEAREKIKGHELQFYWDLMNEVRAETKKQFKTKDDDWLLSGETKEWDWNNYCKWFHVAEHFANHRGQMTWYKKRLPGRKG